MPVYDGHVRQNLSLAIPGQHQRPEERVEKFCSVYSDLQAKKNRLIGSEQFPTLRNAFDERFVAHTHFTDTKKLDILLWQYREA